MSATTSVDVDTQTAKVVDRNLELTRGFTQAMLDDPALLQSIPNGVQLVLLPEDDPVMFETNLTIGLDAARRGENVLLRHVTHDGRPK
jgi:hypothetical protein